jgi:hypothetical protein
VEKSLSILYSSGDVVIERSIVMPFSNTLERLYHEHVAASYDKQVFLGASIGSKHRWAFDLEPGRLSFNRNLSFSVDILGTESKDSNTWLWSWANEASNLPSKLVQAAVKIRRLGEEQKVHAFITPELPLGNKVNGDYFARIASGVTSAGCYYRGEHEGGAIFFLITDPAFKQTVSNPVLLVSRIFPDAIVHVEVSDHRAAFLPFLRYYDLAVMEEGDKISGEALSGARVSALFDLSNRLVDLHVEA